MAPRIPTDETDDEEILDPIEGEGEDAGRLDDEGGYEAQAGEEPEEPEAQTRVDRRDRRSDELRALREHNARVEAELNILRQERERSQQQARGPQEETDEQFLARISLLDPEQRQDAKLDRVIRRNERQLALATFAAADRADKAAYDSKANYDPVYKRHAAAVEATMADARRRGMDIDRETALDFVRGRAQRMNQGKTVQAREQGKRRIESQQARTSGGRGDQVRDQQRARRYAPDDNSIEAVRQRLSAPDAYI